MKSSVPESAQWRSSNTRTTGPVAASRSKNVRHAPNSCSRRRSPVSTPRRARRAGSIQRRSAVDRARARRAVAATFARVVGSSSVSARPARPRIISPRAQKLIPSPYAGRPAAVPPDRRRRCRRGTSRTPRRGGSCRCRRCPMTETSRVRPSRTGRVEEVLEQPELVVAPDERRLERVGPAAAAALGDDAQGPPRGDRRRLALERSARPRARRRCAALAARWVASPTSTVPGAATDWRRAAVLTRSPATMPWLVAPRVTAASPVRTPARAWIAGPERPHRVDELEGRPDGALGVVLARGRRAPDGHHRVADELLDGPAVAGDDLAWRGRSSGSGSRGPPRVALLGERREADEVGEQDRDQAALGDGAGRRVRGSDGRSCRRHEDRRPRGDRSRTGTRGRAERRPAFAAELLARLIGHPTGRAGRHERSSALRAELASRPVLGPAAGAGQRIPRRSGRRSAEGSGSRHGGSHIADVVDSPISAVSTRGRHARLRFRRLAAGAFRLVCGRLLALGLATLGLVAVVVDMGHPPHARSRQRPAPAGPVPEVGGRRVELAGRTRAAAGTGQPVRARRRPSCGARALP